MGNQRRFIVSVMLVAIFQLVFAYAIYAAGDSSCVTCHTNESLMKSMHKPPVLPQNAGEG